MVLSVEGFAVEGGIAGAITTGVVSVLKPLIPKKFIPLVSWVIAGLGMIVYGKVVHQRPVVIGLAQGLTAGFLSNAGYDQVKALTKAKEA